MMPPLHARSRATSQPALRIEIPPDQDQGEFEDAARAYIDRNFVEPKNNTRLREVGFERRGDQYLVTWSYDDYSATFPDGRPCYRWNWSIWVTASEFEPAPAQPPAPTTAPVADPQPAPQTETPLPGAPAPADTPADTSEPERAPDPPAPKVETPVEPRKAEKPDVTVERPKAVEPKPPVTGDRGFEYQPTTLYDDIPSDLAELGFVTQPVIPGADGLPMTVTEMATEAQSVRFQQETERREIQRGAEQVKTIARVGGEVVVIGGSLAFPVAGVVVGAGRTALGEYNKAVEGGATTGDALFKAVTGAGVSAGVNIAGGKIGQAVGGLVAGKGAEYGLSATGQALTQLNVDAAGNYASDQIVGALLQPTGGRTVETYNPPPAPPEIYDRGGFHLELQR